MGGNIHVSRQWYQYMTIKTYYSFDSIIKSETGEEISMLRSSHKKCSIEMGVLKKFAKFTVKHLCQVWGLQLY